MPGYDNKTKEHQNNNLFFIHNCFGSFFSGVLNWFADDFYPRFNYKVIGTYDKSVEFFKKKKELGVDASSNLLPSITLDPTLDFSNDERAGKFLWQYSRYAPAMGVRLWKSIDLREQDILITPVFSRYQGTFEVIFWLSSIYELMDFRVALLQFCGGFQRWCRPEFFWTYLILPDAIENYEKEDGYNIDWGNTLSDVIHVDTINKHRRVVPIALDPMWRLESFSDASTKYGGDQIAEYKLSASFAYEINLPTYIVTSEHVDAKILLSLSLGNAYTKYPLISPYKVLKYVHQDARGKKYLDKKFNYYEIENILEHKDQLLVEFNRDSAVYPDKPKEWNHIVSGKLIHVNDEYISNPDNRITRGNIVLIDGYKKEYLPYIRSACAVISLNDLYTSMFYEKCTVLKKPCICSIKPEEYDVIISHLNQNVTLDTIERLLYSGELSVVALDQTSPEFSFESLQAIKINDPELYKTAYEKAMKNEPDFNNPEHLAQEYTSEMKERLINNFTDGIQTDFLLDHILDSDNATGLLVYVNNILAKQNIDYSLINGNIIRFFTAPLRGSAIHIGGEYMVLIESKLVAIYEFTDDDMTQTAPIIVPLHRPIDRIENIVLVSYIGKLEYEKDYSINFDDNIVTINLRPKVGELIQFFYYV